MKEILLTSSVLILALVLLRQLLGKHVSKGFQYALWGLVLLRLLIPVQFGSLSFSISSLTQDSEPIAVIEYQISQPMVHQDYNLIYQRFEQQYENQGYNVASPEVVTQITQETVEFMDLPTWREILKCLWFLGIAAMAVWFAWVNIRFRRSAGKNAERLEVESPIPVYVSAGVASPCLTGLLRPVIYLTPACAADDRLCRHALTHELTHYRHGDHVWSILRSLCLCVYWFDPLVWLAAILSRRDCELACDEGALKRLGEQERLSYGRSLVDVVAGDISPRHLMEAATAMNESKRQITERVNRIVKKPKFYVVSAICLLLAAALIAGCAFAGKVSKPEPEQDKYLLLETVTQTHSFDGTPDKKTWEQRSYDENGHLTRIAKADEENNITVSTVECDRSGNATRIENRIHGDISEAITTWNKLTYNSDGYLLSDREYAGTGLQANQVQGKEYTYDKNGNEQTCRYTMGDYVWESTKTYDSRGNVATQSIVNGDYSDRTEYTYDAQDRLTRKVTYVHGETDRVEEYTYSEDGLTVTMVAWDGTGAELGKTIKTKSADGRSAEAIIYLPDGTEEQRSTYVYDEAGNCTFEQVYLNGRLNMTTVSRYMKPGEKGEYMLTYLPGDEVMDTQLYPFPGTTWGMTPDQVIKALDLKEGEYTVELPEDGESSHILTGIQTELFGVPAEAYFVFSDFYSPGVYRLYTVTAGFSSDTDVDKLLSQMTLCYSAPKMTSSMFYRWDSSVSSYDLMTSQDQAYVDQQSSWSQSTYKGSGCAYIDYSINGRYQRGLYRGQPTNKYIEFHGPLLQFSKTGIFSSMEEPTDLTEPLPIPGEPQVDTLVTTGVETHLEWNDTIGNQERFDARLPQLHPFSQDAIAINQHITDKYGAMVAECEDAAAEGYSSHLRSIDYETYLNGDLLSLVITTETTYDYTDYEVFNFRIYDSETIQTLDTAAMAKAYLGLSYPEYLYAVKEFTLAQFAQDYAGQGQEALEDFKDQYLNYVGMAMGDNPLDLYQSALFLDENGQLMLRYNRISMAGADSYPTLTSFTPGDTIQLNCYSWLINLENNGHNGTQKAYLHLSAFLSDPELFSRYVTRENNLTMRNIASSIVHTAGQDQSSILRYRLESLPDSIFKTQALLELDTYYPQE